MNNGQFETLCTLDGGSYKYGYIINCWNNRRTALTDHLQGCEIMGAVKLACVKIYPSRLLRSVQQVEDDTSILRLIYRFTVNKMILKYRIRAKTRTTNDMMNRQGKEL